MSDTAVIKLASISKDDADSVMQQIKTITSSLNIKTRGPFPLPTKKIKLATRKAPGADGSHTFEKWELRIHKRLMKIYANDQALRQIMRIAVPDTVQIEITLM
ncbi:MAG: 30S ribosomal protein S10 [Candidatus Marsarchaeota archaeon]|jgi:small subunit ribosomal protein S10|uniref:Small ribosomal subunit protein uS10 n=1 Tax=Candidatus Micrarchaeum acidiphilum ARMAN-2 TaxID=425595 RepID=C7DGQ0_MICA2|nr:MAG: ribosomal protein S10 [Candidatus Micrarchaeum acidiphilum ARMAN-2]MCL5434761.1 30S ribosomal protein S10 [Candidatus Marsarchaeota archaeon]MCW6161195.1 30S ribosomal protein S10 [Candidatus Micrarchaeales archaeon]